MRPPRPATPAASPQKADSLSGEGAETLFAGLFGLLLGIGLLKFGNPILLDRLVEIPRTFDEWRVFSWPIRIGYIGLLIVSAVGAWCILGRRWRPSAPRWILGLLVLWITWQIAATLASQDRPLSLGILAHFLACVACFTLGHLALSQVAQPRTFWLCLVAGLVGVLGMAFDQRFGGLEATRKMILEGPQAASLAPEYLARIQSNRVFSTLVYPNALAGVILLLLPTGWVLAREIGAQRSPRVSWMLASGLLAAGLAVLVWSGSKSAWLLAMGIAVLLLFLGKWPRRMKWLAATAFVAAGLVAFSFVFREKLRGGATSVSARFDYWSAAADGFRDRPVLGHGPGLFKRVYGDRKRPESEMAQLAHNDYLQQATDSGLPGFVGYLGFVGGSLLWLFRRRTQWASPLPFAVWLGLLGWFAHGCVEFGLYIPASAWCAFTLLGWLLAQKPSGDPP